MLPNPLIQRTAQRVQQEFIRTWMSPKLTGACLMASLDLQTLLRQQGILARLVKGQVVFQNRKFAHYWLEVDDCVWDVTARQFDLTQMVFPVSDKARYQYLTNLYFL